MSLYSYNKHLKLIEIFLRTHRLNQVCHPPQTRAIEMLTTKKKIFVCVMYMVMDVAPRVCAVCEEQRPALLTTFVSGGL